MRTFISAVLSGVSLMAITTPAFSQAAPASDSASATEEKDIVVTGTLIRGKAPVGSNLIVIGAAKLEETGAISSNALLASIPQVTNYFNKVPIADLSTSLNAIQISRPNLRNISPSNAASSATLILVDGHRVATAGVNQASVDPDLIPTGAIERVDVATEGGSATYGTDAVAGVINFITRKRFNGVEVGGNYGFAKNYWQIDAKATVGKDWGSGSLWASYSYAKSDFLFGRERDYIRDVDYSKTPNVGRDLTCANSNLVLGTVINGDTTVRNLTSYSAPAFVAGTSNVCDNSKDTSIVPRAERHGIIVGLSQDLDDRTTVDMRAYYSQRETLALANFVGSVGLGPLNPASATLPAGLVVGATEICFTPTLCFPATTSANVNFNLNSIFGPSTARRTTSLKQYGFNAEFKHDLNDNWQIKGLLNFGESDTSYSVQEISQARLTAAGLGSTAATGFNPINIAGNNAALIADLIDNAAAGQAKNRLFNARFIAEGKLLDLPGGDARLAVGYEYINDSESLRSNGAIRIGQLRSSPFTIYTRNVNSVFGELQLPIISDGDGGSMLTVSAAARYDKYSDFGGTFNPKFGAVFKPFKWLAVRGNWGTSFTAPTSLDQIGSLNNSTSYNANFAFDRPGEAKPAGAGTAAIRGALTGLQPQKATTWSIGADVTPVQNLKMSANYYNVVFKNILQNPFSGNPFVDFPANYNTKVTGFTPTEVAAFFGSTPGAATTIAAIGNQLVYELVDFRTGNFGVLKVSGLDLSANYKMPTGFGGLDLSVNANIPLSRKSQISPTSAINNEFLTENPKLFLQATLGATVGNFRAQATLNHNGGYAITPITNIAVPQDRVGAFSTVNLFFKYDVPSSSAILKDLSLTLNIGNVFDKNPPELRRNGARDYGYANGFTLGRLVQIGLTKKF